MRFVTVSRLRQLALAFLALSVSSFALAQNNIVSGSGTVFPNLSNPDGQVYDQVLLTGQTVTLQADTGQVLRCSFLDTNGDIVQAEFAGPGQFKIDLDASTFVAAAPPSKYNQSNVNYVTGRPTVTVTGNTASTYVNIFTVGSATAVNQALFKAGEVYDGVADVQLLSISGPAIGRIRAGNTRFGGSAGMTGIFAPNTNVAERAVLYDIKASGSATPVLQFGAGSTFSVDGGAVLLAGGNLVQPNNAAVDVTSGSGTTLASITTTANIKSDGSSLTRTTISASVTFTGGASGSLRIDGTAITNSNTGATSGSFSANFTDLIAGSSSPLKVNGVVGATWSFSGGNSGTWQVQTTTNTSGFSSTATLGGTYTYVLSNNNQTFTLTMNYDTITASVAGLGGITSNLSNGQYPTMPKSLTYTVTRTSETAGTYTYALTTHNGQITQFSGNYNSSSPLGLPTS
jgi:hypothetical protein